MLSRPPPSRDGHLFSVPAGGLLLLLSYSARLSVVYSPISAACEIWDTRTWKLIYELKMACSPYLGGLIFLRRITSDVLRVTTCSFDRHITTSSRKDLLTTFLTLSLLGAIFAIGSPGGSPPGLQQSHDVTAEVREVALGELEWRQLGKSSGGRVSL